MSVFSWREQRYSNNNTKHDTVTAAITTPRVELASLPPFDCCEVVVVGAAIVRVIEGKLVGSGLVVSDVPRVLLADAPVPLSESLATVLNVAKMDTVVSFVKQNGRVYPEYLPPAYRITAQSGLLELLLFVATH